MTNKEAIETIKIALAEVEWEYPMDYAAAFETAIEALEKQAASEWIPVSEKLPEESGTYIVNAIENCIVHVTFAKWMKRMKKWNLTGSRSYWKVTAWQPLPEPWKGEVNE